jgi:acyl-CoA synthetase (AMP-forming)/AMP-acid ligase II
MLKGQMMDQPLLVSRLIDFAAEVHGPGTIVTSTVEGGLHRYTYAQALPRIARLANALIDLGVKPGDRVATLAWNTYRISSSTTRSPASVRSAIRSIRAWRPTR